MFPKSRERLLVRALQPVADDADWRAAALGCQTLRILGPDAGQTDREIGWRSRRRVAEEPAPVARHASGLPNNVWLALEVAAPTGTSQAIAANRNQHVTVAEVDERVVLKQLGLKQRR